MVFVYPREEEITEEVVLEFITQHQVLLPKYLESKNMYEGNHEILNQEAKAEYKPDNRLVVNLAKYIVDTYNGYFIGIPVKVTHDDTKVNESVQNFRNRSDMDDNESELAKICAIYGHAYEYLYQDEEAYTNVVYNTPLDMFVVYDDTIAQKPLFAVRYHYDKEGKLAGEMVDSNYRYYFKDNEGKLTFTEEEQHFYGDVPIVEYIENEERQSVFENVKTLINAINKSLSEKANDVDYFSDAYIKILGEELDEESIQRLRDNRIINLAGDGASDVIVEFMQKPNADTTQENLLDRLLDLVFQVAMVANINDESFGNASGVALEFKLQPMKNLAVNKERKMKSGMQKRYKMIFNLMTNIEQSKSNEWMNLGYVFTRNIPRNLADEAETAAKLEGVVSKETQLGTLSVVDNPQLEMERMAKENEPAPQYDFQVGE